MIFPTPSEQETKSLLIVIEDWASKTDLQRAVCLCLLRGDDAHQKIADRLGVTADKVRASLKGVWGVLYDHTRDKLWIK